MVLKEKNKGRNYVEKEKYVVDMVVDWWNIGDPVGKLDLYGEILARNGFSEGTNFYNNYIDPMKLSAVEGF